MTEPRLEHDLREVLSMDAPDGAPAGLRDRVRADLSRESARPRRSAWLPAAAAALVVALGAIAVIGPRIGPGPAGTSNPGTSPGGSTNPATSGPTSGATLPRLPEPIDHPGFLVNGALFDREHGFAQTWDGTLLLTASGGETWRLASTQRGDFNFSSGEAQPWFLDAAHGWLIEVHENSRSDMIMWRTFDGGATWTRSLVQGVRAINSQLQFLDPRVGWLGTDPGGQHPKPELRWTDDGGETWSGPIDMATATGQSTFPFGMAFVDPERGFAVDQDGLRRTDDGGQSWQTVVLQPPEGLGVAIHGSGAYDFTCLHAHCAGRSWQDFRAVMETGRAR